MRFPETPLVLLHAFPLDHRMWDEVRPGIAEHIELITPDQRGFGDASLGDDEPDLATVATDVIDRLGGRRVVLGGCSMGGYVAMAVLREAPELVAGLLLVSTRATADADAGRANRHAMASRIEEEGPGFVPDAVLPTLLGSETTDRRPEVVAAVRTLVSEQDGAAIAWAQRAMAARPDSSEILRNSDVPTLIVRGEQDTLIPAEEADALAALMPKAEVVVLAGAGHLPPLEVPEQFTGAVARWLE
ncbi:alpha/beta fold hydrolase [Actinophytocola algeriensis]|uniref:Pimeloyl-ACP methyl ester carboxylesterase n=1 Tax=Actinophytocola algeriensis TaxID=1768010 RepID=A0A7W7Q6Y5_9PSEU|nr:alpha/beta hydrolase [Actinophytocola algeriensis]MBB4908062.1 pimeloyl-ACP methyl ester carboxylesterase [Actinophytocola algeriensis]MBE1480092.1 pimeloyl-ACP methyl ester carboxylesterase [Actinophytocola algeriensis]